MPVRGFDTAFLSIEFTQAVVQEFVDRADQMPGPAEAKAPPM
jgi:hypothetical protein